MAGQLPQDGSLGLTPAVAILIAMVIAIFNAIKEAGSLDAKIAAQREASAARTAAYHNMPSYAARRQIEESFGNWGPSTQRHQGLRDRKDVYKAM